MTKLSARTAAKLRGLKNAGETPGNRPPAFGGGSGYVPSSDDDLRIVITTDVIAPDTYGPAKFTTGAKGSESITGDAYQMFYRSYVTDPPDIPSGTKCYAQYVACDSLEENETGWELRPCACIEE